MINERYIFTANNKNRQVAVPAATLDLRNGRHRQIQSRCRCSKAHFCALRGRNRSNLDTVRLGQVDGTISSLHTQTVRAFLAGRFCQTSNRWSNAEINQEYAKHHVAIDFIVSLFALCKDNKINDHTIRGLLARAFYHVAPERITAFASKLTHCNGNGGDPIVTLWQCLHAWNDRRLDTKREIYRRTMATLLAFLQNQTDTLRIDVSKNLFPIPQCETVRADEL